MSAVDPSLSPLVRLEGVSKRYVKYDDLPLLLSRLKFRARNKKSFLWALKDISLDVGPGETVGVIGRNGSGKSTMLRMLAGVTAPSLGSVTVQGRVAPLIAVGVGFHPELTGRENVYVNGSILGLSRKEIDAKFDDIVAFAEIEDFIDTPVKFYSSGMFVRLGFSVAVAANPEVLLVDEVLAVGDFAFQQKCFDRMAEIQAQGTIVLVVSHNITAIRRLCQRVMVLHYGESKFSGSVEEGISIYHELLSPQYALTGQTGDAPIELSSMRMLNDDGTPTAHARSGQDVTLRIEVRFLRAVEEATFSVSLRAESGQLVYAESTYRTGRRRFNAGETATFEARLPLRVTTGTYVVRTSVAWGNDPSERQSALPLNFYVSGRAGAKGFADLGATLDVEGGTLLTLSPNGRDPLEDERPVVAPSAEPDSSS
jgi:ABC-type polysaccharide/polyol phosphate transport system ATPase subunit